MEEADGREGRLWARIKALEQGEAHLEQELAEGSARRGTLEARVLELESSAAAMLAVELQQQAAAAAARVPTNTGANGGDAISGVDIAATSAPTAALTLAPMAALTSVMCGGSGDTPSSSGACNSSDGARSNSSHSDARCNDARGDAHGSGASGGSVCGSGGHGGTGGSTRGGSGSSGSGGGAIGNSSSSCMRGSSAPRNSGTPALHVPAHAGGRGIRRAYSAAAGGSVGRPLTRRQQKRREYWAAYTPEEQQHLRDRQARRKVMLTRCVSKAGGSDGAQLPPDLAAAVSSSSAAEPTDNGGSEVQPGAGARFNKLAAKGDWYEDSYKEVHVSFEKGDVNGSNICSGRFASMYLGLHRSSSDSSVDGKSSDSYVHVRYHKGTWRDCTPDETSTSSSYSASGSCCRDRVTLSGYATLPEAPPGTFKLGLKGKLITAKVDVAVPLDQSSSSSSDSNGASLTATAVVKLQMDCVNVINRYTTQAGDSCVRGDCVSFTGEDDKYWCTTKADDATLTGTIELKGDIALTVDLAKLPAGYTMSARADFEADNGKVIS
ncbi:hypothetical protein JKP88DRAFT_283151 [Tribonema minus]|uniref:Uncharacterized protein n=1 Tax=Tribonema minus TaxID=303371 RepID=A0A836C7V9_9STRA|nr:hypothetical protein JKP88DRAFT_283151 [Tribonema minus]